MRGGRQRALMAGESHAYLSGAGEEVKLAHALEDGVVIREERARLLLRDELLLEAPLTEQLGVLAKRHGGLARGRGCGLGGEVWCSVALCRHALSCPRPRVLALARALSLLLRAVCTRSWRGGVAPRAAAMREWGPTHRVLGELEAEGLHAEV